MEEFQYNYNAAVAVNKFITHHNKGALDGSLAQLVLGNALNLPRPIGTHTHSETCKHLTKCFRHTLVATGCHKIAEV